MHYYITGVIPLFWFPVPFMLMSKSYWKNYRTTPVIQSLLIWVVLVIIFFSISPGKRRRLCAACHSDGGSRGITMDDQFQTASCSQRLY
ncbi:hypothetical protein [Vibrio fluvialis]|uniref:hypothetical protein n=1 Tax=Vibrio fluvialis TaxID=676 RepID=UPI001E5AC48B|nr:hypothetical protein [Vibrio fluvialis]